MTTSSFGFALYLIPSPFFFLTFDDPAGNSSLFRREPQFNTGSHSRRNNPHETPSMTSTSTSNSICAASFNRIAGSTQVLGSITGIPIPCRPSSFIDSIRETVPRLRPPIVPLHATSWNAMPCCYITSHRIQSSRSTLLHSIPFHSVCACKNQYLASFSPADSRHSHNSRQSRRSHS